VRDRRTGALEELAAETVFALIGATPRTEWLAGVVQRDAHGYLLTGRDVDLRQCAFPANRAPTHFSTSIPGVFAAGDVRHDSEKRVASAVGEGAAVVGSIHELLHAPIAAQVELVSEAWRDDTVG
jgi:thioredoxin reductase (NADPH)